MFDTMSMGTNHDDFDDIQCEEVYETAENQFRLELEAENIDPIAEEDSPSLTAQEYDDLLKYAAEHFVVV